MAARFPAQSLSSLVDDERANWPNILEVDYQDAVITARRNRRRPRPVWMVDPELLRTFEKLGIPLSEQKQLAGVAVDAVFDSVSVATTYKKNLRHG
jgi:Fe-S cluster assembly protein SufB